MTRFLTFGAFVRVQALQARRRAAAAAAAPRAPPLSPAEKKRREATCPKYEKGVNYGNGAIHQEKTKTVEECCKLCADNSECKAWDWNPSSSACYEKDNDGLNPGATCPGTLCRYSAKMPSKAGGNATSAAVAVAAPAPPGGGGKSHRMTGDPPESTAAFDDSAWDLVDTPCAQLWPLLPGRVWTLFFPGAFQSGSR